MNGPKGLKAALLIWDLRLHGENDFIADWFFLFWVAVVALLNLLP